MIQIFHLRYSKFDVTENVLVQLLNEYDMFILEDFSYVFL